jgi:hypothetical protein
MKKLSKILLVILFGFVLVGSVSCQSKNVFQSITVNRKPNKVVYFEGELFDPTGLQVFAKYSKDKDKNVTAEITYPDTPLVAAQSFIVLTYTEAKITKTVNLPIQVLSINLELLYVSHQPNKLIYSIGETFDPTGMIINAYYSNQTEKVVDDYTISKTTPLTASDFQITISYTQKGLTKSIILPISVEKISLVALLLTVQPNKLVYNLGETFDVEGLVVNAVYSTSLTEVVTPTAISFSGILTESGEKTITISYTSLGETVTAQFKIYVFE